VDQNGVCLCEATRLMKLCDDLLKIVQISKEQNEMLLKGALRDALTPPINKQAEEEILTT